nr:hypothetical protein [Tanacetum cinerariifolium]
MLRDYCCWFKLKLLDENVAAAEKIKKLLKVFSVVRVILKIVSYSYYCQYKVISASLLVSAASIVVNTVSIDDLSSHNTKYTSPAITQKVFANMRRIGKGFSEVDTPLFDGMLVQQQVQAVEDVIEDEDDDNEVSAEPTPPSPTPVTPPPSPTQEHVPSPPQAQIAQS